MSNIQAGRSRALIGLALAAGLAAPALAGSQINVMASNGNSRTMRTLVKIADLDLASAAGKSVLDRRIALAARDVCGSDQLYTIEAQGDYLTCRANALRDAHAQLEQRVAVNSNVAIRLSGG